MAASVSERKAELQVSDKCTTCSLLLFLIFSSSLPSTLFYSSSSSLTYIGNQPGITQTDRWIPLPDAPRLPSAVHVINFIASSKYSFPRRQV